jgi:hypothetical protein
MFLFSLLSHLHPNLQPCKRGVVDQGVQTEFGDAAFQEVVEAGWVRPSRLAAEACVVFQLSTVLWMAIIKSARAFMLAASLLEGSMASQTLSK